MVLDEIVAEAAERAGATRACEALGVNHRSYRHRRQARLGRARRRARAPVAVAAAAGDGAAAVPIAAGDEASGASPSVTVDPPAGTLALAVAAVVAPVVAERALHPAALSSEERATVLDLLCSDRFMDLSPKQVFMTLLDEGVYLCSVRSMYRLLEDHGLAGDRRRGAHRDPGTYPMPVIEATAPNRAWSWDITKLRGPAKGILYYLYTILDIYSRKVVGWRLALREGADIAEDLIREATEREGILPGQLTLHADRGGPMIAGGVAELLVGLGVTKSHSRPRVSNDNPYSEAQFKTMKFRPDYPDRFESALHASDWCRDFFGWYNTVHYHSGIGYLRPADLHEGRHPTILEQRRATLDQARARHPERFRRHPALAEPPQRAWINQPRIQTS